MKEFIDTTQSLRDIKWSCEKKVAGVEGKMREQRDKISKNNKAIIIKNEHIAATKIQQFWRKAKIKAELSWDAYSYLSLIKTTDHRSAIMFGLHVSELSDWSLDKSSNPFLDHKRDYHRLDKIAGKFIDALWAWFDVPVEEREKYDYIPVMILKNTPVKELLYYYRPSSKTFTMFIEKAGASIALLAIRKNYVHLDLVRRIIETNGFNASLWDIAQHIPQHDVVIPPLNKALIIPMLSGTKEALLQSECFMRLNRIARDERYPTRYLAFSVIKIMKQLPPLTSEAIQRIALMLDITLTFYAYHYSKFSFFVYTLIHEVSLALLDQTDADDLAKQYEKFTAESEMMMKKIFNLPEIPENVICMTMPAASGTNAHALVLDVLRNINCPSGYRPTQKVISPTYYEFNSIMVSTTIDYPDIFFITCGPTISQEGLSPGIDVNCFVRHHILPFSDRKPVTLVVDTTTALHENLKLEDDVIALIKAGQLSLITHESCQKFGLLHTDVAQYGMVRLLCQKNSFSALGLKEIKQNSQGDFATHVDFRIGAFITVVVGETLEDIKQQHFRNGGNFDEPSYPLEHDDMLRNSRKNYFFFSQNERHQHAVRKVYESRSSFGHYETSYCMFAGLTRISFDASDDIDARVQSLQFYIACRFTTQEIKQIIIEYAKHESLSLSEQLICLAMMGNIAPNGYEQFKKKAWRDDIETKWAKVKQFSPSLFVSHLDSRARQEEQRLLIDVRLWPAMNIVLEHCDLLRFRQLFVKVEKYLLGLRQEIIDTMHPNHIRKFFSALSMLNDRRIEPQVTLLKALAISPILCQQVIEQPDEYREMLAPCPGK